MKNIFLAILATISMVACKHKSETIAENNSPQAALTDYLSLGDSISAFAQQILLSNVSAALGKGGPVYAVDFCHENAGKIMDSLSIAFNAKIQRISLKNRNSNNTPADAAEKQLMEFYVKQSEAGNMIKDTLITTATSTLYFKPVKLAMPACLKCHGKPGTDIDDKTLALLKEKYPNDKAVGYSIGEFRGAWKISFTK